MAGDVRETLLEEIALEGLDGFIFFQLAFC